MKLRYNKFQALAGIALGALMLAQGSAQAESSTAAEIRMLKERLKQLEKQVAEQAKAKKAAAAKPGYAVPAAPLVCKDGPCEPPPMPPPVWVSFVNGLKVESYDKDFSFHVGGRIQVDGGVASEPLTGQSGNVIFRRARLEVDGKAFKYWLYKFQYDFTSSGVAGIRDAYLAFKWPGLAILPFTSQPIIFQVGNSKEPFSLEELTSSKYITFIERALPVDTFSPSRHIGIAMGTHGDNWSAKVGVYSTSPQDDSQAPAREFPSNPAVPGSVATGGKQYLDIAGRVTYAPILEKDALLHLGGGARYQVVNSATGGTESRALILGGSVRSEANALRINLLGTPDLSCGLVFGAAGECTKDFVTWNAELAASYGPFNLQGEYFGNYYNRSAQALARAQNINGGPDASGGTSLNFNGFYVYGTWFLTGESRAASYKVGALNSAEFGRISILNPVSKGGIGAWEIAGRYSQVNLNDGGILGGRQEDFTLGLNWYPEKGVRLMANWVHVAHISAPYNRPWVGGAQPDIFLMRAQVDW
jgi:phosphate-selective porin OprO/OprP